MTEMKDANSCVKCGVLTAWRGHGGRVICPDCEYELALMRNKQDKAKVYEATRRCPECKEKDVVEVDDPDCNFENVKLAYSCLSCDAWWTVTLAYVEVKVDEKRS